MDTAVVVLTRGYSKKEGYSTLIKRNKKLERYYNKNIRYIIFHEGNISENHQEYIQLQTIIPLNFVNVSKSFRTEKIDFYPPTSRFSLDYRNMCNFWFCDFWMYLTDYNKILRIDEDCFYESDYNNVFNILDDKVAVYGLWSGDEEFVTKGLQDFTKTFMYQHNKKPLKNKIGGPYTNVLGLNLKEMRKNMLLTQYIKTVKKSDNIYIYRWGDLPLWGEALSYCFPINSYTKSNQIQYYHGSHNKEIGMNNIKMQY